MTDHHDRSAPPTAAAMRAAWDDAHDFDPRDPLVGLSRHAANATVYYETKRFSIDPYSAKGQAKDYAVSLGAPFVVLSNGREHYFWDYNDGDARPIVGMPSRADLERRANLR